METTIKDVIGMVRLNKYFVIYILIQNGLFLQIIIGGDCCGPNVKKNYCKECKCLDPSQIPDDTSKKTKFLKPQWSYQSHIRIFVENVKIGPLIPHF